MFAEYCGTFGGKSGSLPGSPFRIKTCKPAQFENKEKEAKIRNSFSGQGSLQFDHLKDEIKRINLFIKSSSRTMSLNVKPGDIQTLLKVKGSMREVESESETIHKSYDSLKAINNYMLSEECKNAFNGIPPMAKGSPEFEKYHSSQEVQKRKDKKAKSKKEKAPGIMSTKLDRNFIKSSMTSCDESSIKFASLESVEVKKTRNRIRPIENKESAKVRSQAQAFNESITTATKDGEYSKRRSGTRMEHCS